MKVIKPGFEIMTPLHGEDILRHIEACGRTCYKSEGNITAESAPKLVNAVIQRGHESVLEHYSISVRIVCDRGVSHEIVRHRIASYSQESTRYCNYSQGKFGNELTFIAPAFFADDSPSYSIWYQACQAAEKSYMELLAAGAKPEQARSVLPNSLKTELVMTTNLRDWRHVFCLRTAPDAHPQMREIMIPMLSAFQKMIPVVFDDIEVTA